MQENKYGIKYYLNELLNFSSFILHMIWAFPISMYTRYRLRRNKKLLQILCFPAMISARNNIEKGSFAYDSLLFKENIFSLLKNKSHLANLVCLAIIFGDEYIDGLAQLHGKEKIKLLFVENAHKFDLQMKYVGNDVVLFYDYQPKVVFDVEMLQSINAKYNISYAAYYQHLLFLLSEINAQLNKQPVRKRNELATIICKACNNCFVTYVEDVTLGVDNYSFQELQLYQQKKDDAVVYNLLELRALLLDKKQNKYKKQYASWSAMLRSMQVYDDMQDIAQDCFFQKNILAFYAKTKFPMEWDWFLRHSAALNKLQGSALHLTICLNMPGAVIYAMKYARNVALEHFNWVQLKIQNYLWRKAWLCWNDENETVDALRAENLFVAKEYECISDVERNAHKVHCILLQSKKRKLFLKKIGRRKAYILRSSFVEVKDEFKSSLLQHNNFITEI